MPSSARVVPAADELRNDDGYDDIEGNREDKRVLRHGDGGESEQQAGDRREGDDHDRIVQRHLRQREHPSPLRRQCAHPSRLRDEKLQSGHACDLLKRAAVGETHIGNDHSERSKCASRAC